jgi:hypothetical protein
MFKNKVMALAFSLFALVGGVNAQEKYSKVKVSLPSVEAKRELVQLLQLDHFQVDEGSITCEVGARELRALKASRFRYEVLVDDLAAYLVAQNKRSSATKDSKRAPSNLRMAYEITGKTITDIIPKPAAFTTAGAMGWEDIIAILR